MSETLLPGTKVHVCHFDPKRGQFDHDGVIVSHTGDTCNVYIYTNGGGGNVTVPISAVKVLT
jgi:hypothetical protein